MGLQKGLLARSLGADIRHLKLRKGVHPSNFGLLAFSANGNSCTRATIQLQS